MMAFKLFAPWEFFHAFLSSADFFKINFLKKIFQEYHLSVQIACKSYPQTTLGEKELKERKRLFFYPFIHWRTE